MSELYSRDSFLCNLICMQYTVDSALYFPERISNTSFELFKINRKFLKQSKSYNTGCTYWCVTV